MDRIGHQAFGGDVVEAAVGFELADQALLLAAALVEGDDGGALVAQVGVDRLGG
jgi:hypothetical protein